MGEVSHLHAAHGHPALLQHKDRVQQQRVAQDLYPLGDTPGLTHHVRGVDDKRRGDKALHADHRLDNLRLGGVVLRQIGRVQHHQPHTAGEMARVQHGDILKGLRRLTGIFVAITDMPCHGDVDHVLGLGQALGKESLVVLHLRRLGAALPPVGDMGQKLIRFQLLLVQEAPLLRADIVGTHRDSKHLPQGFRQVADTVGGDQNGPPLYLLED